MKVYFVGSPRFNLSQQHEIYTLLITLGMTQVNDFIIRVDPKTWYENDDQAWQEHYNKCVISITKADFCVFEGSLPSHAIGQLVQESLHHEKPVIVLHDKEYVPKFLIGTSGLEKRLQVLEYSLENLREVLEYGISNVEDLMTTRFTMLMPADLNVYIEKKGLLAGMNRSEYIRHLIRLDMEQK